MRLLFTFLRIFPNGTLGKYHFVKQQYRCVSVPRMGSNKWSKNIQALPTFGETYVVQKHVEVL